MEILEDELDDKHNPVNIESICDKILVKFDRINEQSGPITSREDENFFYVEYQ